MHLAVCSANVVVKFTGRKMGSTEPREGDKNRMFTLTIFDVPEDQRYIGKLTRHRPGYFFDSRRKISSIKSVEFKDNKDFAKYPGVCMSLEGGYTIYNINGSQAFLQGMKTLKQDQRFDSAIK